MDWLLENEPADGGDLPDQTASFNKMARDFAQGAARRNRALAHQFSQIEDALRKLMATPLFRHDEHCQNLMAKIARAGTMRDFADRVDDLHFHIQRLTAQGIGAAMPGKGSTQNLWSRPVDGMAGRISSADSGRSAGARVERYRLKI